MLKNSLDTTVDTSTAVAFRKQMSTKSMINLFTFGLVDALLYFKQAM